ncbi:MAG: hypothetical protein WC661_19305 [Opitutaceae bacterium]
MEKLTHTGGFCFPKATEMMQKNPDGLNWRLMKLVQKAGAKLTAQPPNENQQRKRAPSEIGFHRFKATFVTLALDAGIPIPVIQKIVGNTDVRVLLKHYHRPDKNPQGSDDQQAADVLDGHQSRTLRIGPCQGATENMNAENWQLNRVEVLKLLTPATPEAHFGGTFWGTSA